MTLGKQATINAAKMAAKRSGVNQASAVCQSGAAFSGRSGIMRGQFLIPAGKPKQKLHSQLSGI